MHKGVIVVTVTYGQRWKILCEVLDNILDIEEIYKVIIVDNNSEDDIFEMSRQMSEKIDIIKMNKNEGSAKGFKEGIIKAIEYKECKYIWCLDDDNKPKSNALEVLLAEAENKAIELEEKPTALLSLRTDRKEYIMSSLNNDATKFFPVENSFLGIHFKTLVARLLRKFKNTISVNNQNSEFNQVNVPVAPYGGLFFHKQLIDKIWLPNEAFYLYSDDYEFTYRITKKGGKILLVPDSKIIDIDKTWFVKSNNGFLLSLFTSDSDLRIYYSIRNRVFFERKDLVNNIKIHNINKLIFLSITFVLSIYFKNKDRRSLIKHAIKDGLEGNLGQLQVRDNTITTLYLEKYVNEDESND
ncbi:glycosyltransferase [Aquibacillus rhizosphaerae]|uniref:Glycosyltransferase n=1 Tax=Aquibacillus rhizosphaerae TaxID=3051431 RepID=A0ABT7L1E6_9BACI|nr:glycosyltransferase [Aquibacillus sp. LR5S19]MDL4838955.1 glycosyltransferase [Aquibacillus sp. LR5S19]